MKNKIWGVCILLLAILNIYWFWPGKLFFLNDDLLHIPLTDQGRFFQTNSVRPIHELLVRFDLFLWGKKAYGYHITALVLHLVVCLQLFDLSFLIQLKWLKINRQQALHASYLAVVLFLVYPESSESLAWVLGRAPILSAFFLMVTIRLLFSESFQWHAYAAGAIFFAASLFTYEQTLFVPIALFFVPYLEKVKRERAAIFRYAFLLSIVSIMYLIVRKLITSEVIGQYEGGNLIARNWTLLVGNSFRLFFRLVLNPAYKTTFLISAVVVFLLTGFIILVTGKLQRNARALTFFSSIITLLIVPVISLGVAVNSFESGRFLYLPAVFFIMAIGIAAIAAYEQNAKFKKPLITLLIFVLAY